MEEYLLGERVRLGSRGPSRSDVPVNRIEVVRPDGTGISKDWDRKPMRFIVDQPGQWLWRMYVRDGLTTTEEHGLFQVVHGDTGGSPAPGRLTRLRRRLTRRH